MSRVRRLPIAAAAATVALAMLFAALLVPALPARDADGSDSRARHDRDALARIAAPPLGLPPVPLPGNRPPSAEAVRLGRKLFLDRRLSHNGTLSCAMCHVPEQGFTVNEIATAVGKEGRSLRRNAPTLLNAAYQRSIFHDGRETSLENQAIAPLIASDEMANPSIGYLIERIEQLTDYDGLFEAAFGRGPGVETIGMAIAGYERTLLSANSPFDRWYYGGEEGALAPRAVQGFRLFVGKAGCAACHLVGERSALFTDHAFHDTGIGWYASVVRPHATEPVRVELAPGVFVDVERRLVEGVGQPPASDLGRYEVTLDPADRWRYKTPSLRNVALTAPYLHDGSQRTLEAVVRFYNRGGHAHSGLDPLIRPLGLSEADIAALAAFLRSLTGDNVAALVADARSQRVGNPGDLEP